ncbi:YkgJ family cysteine cluster protein [Gracilibacillus marinus]|uniref:YkgJ family cysteine cluster protein n=1 Tax=Gracilibacillus marinus TaxID=630535 RepID=A0ABV8VSY8_9BACI
MENYLTYEQIKSKCEKLSEEYEIDETHFFDIIYIILDSDISVESKLIKSYQELLNKVNDEINTMEQFMDVRPSCAMGCAFCCYYPIIINHLEKKCMEESIRAMPESRQNKIKSHILSYKEKYKNELVELSNLDRDNEQFKNNYKKLNIPCVMLDTSTNSCLAYEIRPLPCRTYVNYANPAVCATSTMPKEPVSYEFLYSQYMGALHELVSELYEEDNLGFARYPDDFYEEKMLFEWFASNHE